MGVKPDSGSQTATTVTAAEVRAITFPPTKGFGRGYDQHEVDRIIARCVATVEALSTELEAARSELATTQTELTALRAQVEQDGSAAVAEHAVNVLNTAQRTADAILRQAHEELESVRDTADRQLEQAREVAANIRRESEQAARQLTNEATRRTAVLEQQAAARLERLTIKTELAQHDIDREAVDLQALRDVSRSQLVDVIDSVLDHITDQYGRAHPLAAQAAAAARRRSAASAQSARQAGVAGRGRRGLRLAGTQQDRRVATAPTATTLRATDPTATERTGTDRTPASARPTAVPLPRQQTGDEQLRG